MKKKSHLNTYDFQIDLIELLKIIWKEKIKIVLITFITILICFAYINQTSKFTNSSLIIRIGELNEFKNFQLLNFKEPTIDSYNVTKLVLETFEKEFMDYEELLTVLIGNEKIKKEVSKLSEYEQKQKLNDYANLFNVNHSDNKLLLKFSWVDTDTQEAINILDQTFKLVLVNVENKILNDLKKLFLIEKQKEIKKDTDYIKNLVEQSAFAREINLSENLLTSNVYVLLKINIDSSEDFKKIERLLEKNLIDRHNLPKNLLDNSTTLLKMYDDSFGKNLVGFEAGEYLQGYKAIDKKIALIKNRKYDEYNLDNFEKKINLLRDVNINWIDYNFLRLRSKSDLNSKKMYLLSIFLGLLIGIMYVLISRVFINQKFLN